GGGPAERGLLLLRRGLAGLARRRAPARAPTHRLHRGGGEQVSPVRPARGTDEGRRGQLLPAGLRHRITTVPSPPPVVSGRRPRGVHSAATVTGRPPETASSRHTARQDASSGNPASSSSPGTTPVSTTGQDSVHGSALIASATSASASSTLVPGGGPGSVTASSWWRWATRARSGAAPG